MARPAKNGIEYFPLDVDFFSDIKVRRIKKSCGPASVSVLICLLCNIYRDGYYILWNEDMPFVISEVIGVAEGAVHEVVERAVRVGFFDKRMFDRYKILTSKGIQGRYMTVVKTSKLKRSGVDPKYDLLVSSEDSPISSEETAISSEETSKSSEESTQRKVKQSKGKERRVFVPPTLEEVEAYCRERGNDVAPKRFFDYFDASGWIDSKGNAVRNWKQKIISWEGRNGAYQNQPSTASAGGSGRDRPRYGHVAGTTVGGKVPGVE